MRMKVYVIELAPVDRAMYAGLFTAVGTSWGAPNAQQFNLPDLRGRFLRGASGSSNVDPDCAGRQASMMGGASGCGVGTIQGDAVPAHTHSVTIPQSILINGYSSGSGTSFFGAGTGSAQTTNAMTSSVGSGTESRPRNAAVAYIVRF